MIEILKQLQSYLPKQSINNETKFDPQLFAGDQLTVERAINVIQSVMNGYTPEVALKGLICSWVIGMLDSKYFRLVKEYIERVLSI